jgi:hypothetical protein
MTERCVPKTWNIRTVASEIIPVKWFLDALLVILLMLAHFFSLLYSRGKLFSFTERR